MSIIKYNNNSSIQEYLTGDKSITNDTVLIKMFLRNQRSKNTVRSYAKSIKLFIDYINKPLSNVTVKDIMDFMDKLEKKEKSTQNNRISGLSSLYNFGCKLGYLKYNPFTVINKPTVNKNKSTNKFLAKEELNRLWEVLREKKRNAVIGSIFITTGVRVSELCNIKCKHFYKDMDSNVGIHIIDGKGNKDRDIKVRQDVLAYIKDYRDSINKDFNIPNDDESYLITTRNGNRVNENYIRWIIDNASKKAGIEKKISPHWLRHTSASMSLNNNCDIVKVTENFGWSSLKVAKGYLHNLDKLKDSSVDYVDIDL
ncbi:tyrosine-type recombinase/integrase [Senegalia massiliensis]|uniref:Tyrosine-type recombinase/integrase n=1 Tax=Senegalia massiliensis TaxID=1720316 RepID=A0A845R043_9CLOT|nr:tyrosine-type recombinase/integrase [Senegalia massiliensis]NBI07574.1 hypothetical protein [Senegalia massiliensis]